MKTKAPREIRFRAWDSRTKQMLNHKLGENHWYTSENKAVIFTHNDHHETALRTRLSQPMQFTGLTDKDGKMIYEGDILAIKFHPRYYERISWKGEPDAIAKVIWDFCGFRLAAKGKEDSRFADFHDEKGAYKMFEMSLMHTEVIGNIIENPELLP